MTDDIKKVDDIDWGQPGNRPLGCNERQVIFVQAILNGYNQTQAARAAGYVGDEKTLRSQGSRTFHSAKVRALLKMARESDDGEEPEGTSEELRKLLWQEARRGGNPSSKVRAMELLAKYSDPLRPEQPLEQSSNLELMRMLENMSADPIWLALVVLFAHNFPVDGFDSPDEKALRGYRMPLKAWKGLEQAYPTVADVLRQKGCGGHREKSDAGKTNGRHNPDTNAARGG